MPKEEVIIKDAKIKYRGTFDLALLYKSLTMWYGNSSYGASLKEIKYVEKVRPDGKQIEIVWELNKAEESGYFKIEQGIKFYITKLNEAEVEKDGQRIKLDKCDLELTFGSKVIINANKSWNENSFIFKIYERYFIGYRVEEIKIAAYKDTNKIMDEVKNFLNLYRF